MVRRCRNIVFNFRGSGPISTGSVWCQRYRVRKSDVRVLLQVGRLPAKEWLQGRKKGSLGLPVGCGTRKTRCAISAQAMPHRARAGLCNRRACPCGRDRTVAERKTACRRIGRAGNADRVTRNGGPQSPAVRCACFRPAGPRVRLCPEIICRICNPVREKNGLVGRGRLKRRVRYELQSAVNPLERSG